MEPPRIVEFSGKELSGVRRRMSLADDRTSELWRGFRSRLAEALTRPMTAYSVRIYGEDHSFAGFDPAEEFDKWAAIESDLNVAIPKNFETVVIPPGRYAVFKHKGTAMDAPKTFMRIFGVWLPTSGYEVDSRPHFEILPPSYDPFDPNAEEEVWLPIRKGQEESTL